MMVENTTLELVTPIATTWRPCKLIQVRCSSKKRRSASSAEKSGTGSLTPSLDETVSSSERSSKNDPASPTLFDMGEEAFTSSDYCDNSRARSDSLSTCSSVSLSILAYDYGIDRDEWEDLDDQESDYFSSKRSPNCFSVGKLIRDVFEDLTYNAPKLARRFDRLMIAAGEPEAQLMD
jgi:hypothetical protein